MPLYWHVCNTSNRWIKKKFLTISFFALCVCVRVHVLDFCAFRYCSCNSGLRDFPPSSSKLRCWCCVGRFNHNFIISCYSVPFFRYFLITSLFDYYYVICNFFYIEHFNNMAKKHGKQWKSHFFCKEVNPNLYKMVGWYARQSTNDKIAAAKKPSNDGRKRNRIRRAISDRKSESMVLVRSFVQFQSST